MALDNIEFLNDKFSGSEVKLDGKKFTLVREDDILGVVG